jgi:hypothetical protein
MELDKGKIVRWVAVFTVVILAITINMPDNMLARYGIDTNFLVIALAAIALTGMIAYRRLGLLFLMVLLVVGANLPESVTTSFNINREWLLATLIALVILPFVQNHFEG